MNIPFCCAIIVYMAALHKKDFTFAIYKELGEINMTKKQFKYDMQRGLGSCVVELKKTSDLERYRDIIVWGCKHELAYDAQCEGSRSYYLYQMIQQYKDWYPFYEAVASRIDKSFSWKFLKYAELLALMANGGYEPAIQKLDDVYEKLQSFLINCRRFLRNKTDNMEMLCIALISYRYDDVEALKKEYIKIVNDLGNLFLAKPRLYFFWSFEWFQYHCEYVIGKRETEKLLKQYEAQSGVQGYLESRQQQLKEKQDKNNLPFSAENFYKKLKEGGKIGKDLPRIAVPYLRNPERKEEITKLSDMYAKEEDIAVRMELLKFLRRSFQGNSSNVERLISDSKSENEVLSEMAFEVLCYVRHDKVHQYALELLQKGTAWNYPLLMLICNYRVEERDMIIDLVKSVPISEGSWWHSIFSAVQDLFKDKNVKNPPKELLYYMYQNTLCSNCRRTTVVEMGRRRMLTREMLEECRFDSNEDIREYACKKL